MTITDIAKIAGVSKGTVSRVVNNEPEGVSSETRQRILNIIDEVGYIPNRVAGSIARAKTKTAGLIIPDIQNMFFPQLVRGAEDCAAAAGYSLFLCNSDSNLQREEQHIRSLLEKRVDGILINTSGTMVNRKFHDLVCKTKTPIVLLDRKSTDFPDSKFISSDNEQGAYEGVRYLIQRGCDHILFFGGPQNVYTTVERYKGYCRALSEAGIPVNDSYVSFGPYAAESGFARAKQYMLLHPKANAIFACSDVLAIGTLRGLREMNLAVPDEVSVLGFDNISTSKDTFPALSTVAQPIYEIGYKAMDMLINEIENPDYLKSDTIMKTSLVIRDSIK